MKRLWQWVAILIGLFFIFSGFVKGVDPIGFGYKLDEYFEVFGEETARWSWLSTLVLELKKISLPLAVVLVVVEMVVGWMSIFFIRMPLATAVMLVLMLFFTALTGYAWWSGKIADCGCFGDAIKLTPAGTFYKDVVLLVLIVPLFLYRNRFQPLFRPVAAHLILLLGLFGSVYLPVYCLRHLPIIDFRPYKVGNDLRQQMTLPPDAKPTIYETFLLYRNKNTGVMQEYPSNDFPWYDSTWVAQWEFVSSRTVLVQQGDQPAISDFHVWDYDRNDVTTSVLDNNQGYHFWLVSYDLEKANKRSFARINALAEACAHQGIPFVGLTATPQDQLERIRQEWKIPFPFYFADATVLKTIIRSNPGLVLLEGTVVRAMWHYNDTPDIAALQKKYFR